MTHPVLFRLLGPGWETDYIRLTVLGFRIVILREFNELPYYVQHR